jgi:hypothetical protein
VSAAIKDSEIAVGWIPFSNKAWQAFNNAPAITHTEVVPSPASISVYIYIFKIQNYIQDFHSKHANFKTELVKISLEIRFIHK